MELVFLKYPTQTIKIYDGQSYLCTCRTEYLRIGESFKDWYNRTEEMIQINPKYKDVKGIAVYNIELLEDVINVEENVFKSTLSIRYDFIRKKHNN